MGAMDRIVILGGGVGGTLTANLLARKLRRQLKAGTAEITRRRHERRARLPAGLHVHRDGRRARREAPSSGARPARQRVDLVVGTVVRVDEANHVVELADGRSLPYDELVLATGSRIVPESIEHFDTEAHHFYTRRSRRGPAGRARRVRRRPDRHRHRRHALQVPAGAARGRLPDRGRAPRARPARAVDDRTSARRSGARSRSRASREMATPILAEKGIELHTFFNVEAIDRDRKVVAEPRGRGAALRPPDPRPAAPGPAVPHRLRARAGAGRLAADRPRHAAGRRAARTSSPSATRPTCRSRRPAPPPTSRRRSSPSGSPPPSRAASRAASTPATTARSCASSRSATARAPCSASTTTTRRSRRSRTGLWHLGKIVFNKTYWHTVPKGRV